MMREMLSRFGRRAAGLGVLAVVFACSGCSLTSGFTRSNPEKTLIEFEHRKAKGDAEGAVALMSPALKEAFEVFGGPARARYQMTVEYETVKKHGGLKDVKILERIPTGENTCRIRYEMTAKDGATVSGQQEMSKIAGDWYIGPIESMTKIQVEPTVPTPSDMPPEIPPDIPSNIPPPLPQP